MLQGSGETLQIGKEQVMATLRQSRRRRAAWPSSVQHVLSLASICQTTSKRSTNHQSNLLFSDNTANSDFSEELVRTFIMDGNFTAEHMRARTSDDEVPLSEGTSFMAEPTRYKEHLSTANHKTIVSY